MPMIQLIEQIFPAAPRQNHGGPSSPAIAWQINDLNANNIARLGERNSKTESNMGLY
jgi:hypothetical protein